MQLPQPVLSPRAGARSVLRRLVTLAAGQAAGKFLQFSEGPAMGVQTAYGIEADVSGYAEAYDPRSMLFMDFRRHHSGVWQDTARRWALGHAASLAALSQTCLPDWDTRCGAGGARHQQAWVCQQCMLQAWQARMPCRQTSLVCPSCA